jgi:hypothetical protein
LTEIQVVDSVVCIFFLIYYPANRKWKGQLMLQYDKCLSSWGLCRKMVLLWYSDTLSMSKIQWITSNFMPCTLNL